MIEIKNQELVFTSCPTDMCHASTLLCLDNGDVLCAWFGGTREGNDDVSIWYSRRTKGGWSAPAVLAGGCEPHWNPVLFQSSPNRIMLFYKVGRKISRWRTFVKESFDNGISWSSSRELVAGDEGGRGPVRNKPIRLSNGSIAAPGSTEEGVWESFADISRDDGVSWEKYGGIRIENLQYTVGKRTVQAQESNIPVSEQSFYGRGVIQPTLWEDSEKKVHMLLRSTEGRIYRSDSSDFGRTWCAAYQTEMPNNNSGIDIVRMDSGILILIYNPVGENWGKRTPISLAVSKDNGISFERVLDLDGGEGEFAYPAVISKGDEVLVSYTYKRKSIAFWQIKITV